MDNFFGKCCFNDINVLNIVNVISTYSVHRVKQILKWLFYLHSVNFIEQRPDTLAVEDLKELRYLECAIKVLFLLLHSCELKSFGHSSGFLIFPNRAPPGGRTFQIE